MFPAAGVPNAPYTPNEANADRHCSLGIALALDDDLPHSELKPAIEGHLKTGHYDKSQVALSKVQGEGYQLGRNDASNGRDQHNFGA
jgi:hypothetical protein